MSEDKSRFNPWIPTVILGVITILFSFYALQSQADTLADEKRIEELEKEVTSLKRELELGKKELEGKQDEWGRAQAECEAARKLAEENCKKQVKRK